MWSSIFTARYDIRLYRLCRVDGAVRSVRTRLTENMTEKCALHLHASSFIAVGRSSRVKYVYHDVYSIGPLALSVPENGRSTACDLLSTMGEETDANDSGLYKNASSVANNHWLDYHALDYHAGFPHPRIRGASNVCDGGWALRDSIVLSH